ncbi:hypothetical protein [Spartinivicinus ruber]|nr:hypothetical protein [Spartinivicinus ruber]
MIQSQSVVAILIRFPVGYFSHSPKVGFKINGFLTGEQRDDFRYFAVFA